ncbi:MAG: hypothetical protein ACXWYT_08055 [Actinomycetota bacterium]
MWTAFVRQFMQSFDRYGTERFEELPPDVQGEIARDFARLVQRFGWPEG